MSEIENDPARAGQLAAPKEHVSARYSVAPVFTDRDSVAWSLFDEFTLDFRGCPLVAAQADTRELAIERAKR